MANYLSRISKSKDLKEKESLGFAYEESKQQVQADILSTKKEINIKKRNLENAKEEVPLSTEKCLKLRAEIEGLVKGLGWLEELLVELFSVEETDLNVNGSFTASEIVNK